MAVVTVSPKYHVTIPQRLREKIGLQAGDLLEAKIESGKITLTRRLAIPPGVEESLADFHAGRTYGPFRTAGEAVASMKRELRKRKT